MKNHEFLSLSLLLIIIISLQVAGMAHREQDKASVKASCSAVVAMLVLERQLTSHGLELGTNYCLGTSAVHFIEDNTPAKDSKFDQPCKRISECGPNMICVQGAHPGYGVCKYGTLPQ